MKKFITINEIEAKTNMYMTNIFKVFRNRPNSYYSILIVACFSNPLIINYLFDSNNSSRRWFLQLNLILLNVIILIYILSRNINIGKIKIIKKIDFFSYALGALGALSVMLINGYILIKSFRYYRLDGRGLEYLIATILLLAFYSYVFYRIALEKEILKFDLAREAIYFLVGSLAILSLSSTRTYEYYVNYSISRKLIFYVWVVFGFYVFSKRNEITRKIRELYLINSYRITFLFITTIVIFIFSFRSDSITTITGSAFHWSYYADVIKTVRSGGLLLVNTPSQYGFLNILIPSILPISDPRSSFYVFQSVLFLILCYIVYRSLKTTELFKSNPIYWTLFPILLIFLADPDLIGPQPYPSSSVARFLPSTLLAIFLIKSKLQVTSFQRSLKISLLLTFNFLWSAESFLYSSYLIFLIVPFSILLHYRNDKILSLVMKIVYQFISIFLLFTTFIGSVSVFSKILTGHFLDYKLLFFYPTKYAQGFGSTELTYNAPFWFPIVLIFFLSILAIRDSSSEDKKNLYVTILILTIWLSYFFGRSVPDNIIAIYPVIIIMTIFAISQKSLFSRFIEARVLITLIATFSFLWGVVLITSTNFPKFVANFETISNIPINNPLEAPADMANDLEVASRKYNSPPVSYFGYLGGLPYIDKATYKSVNFKETFIPSPLGLLEAPLDSEEREFFLRRFYADTNKSSGLLVLDKETFPDRAEQWLIDLDKFFNCEIINDREKYQIALCRN